MKKKARIEWYTEEYFGAIYRPEFRRLLQDQKERHKKAMALISPTTGDKILDAGCGKGEIVKACSERGSFIVGIDFSPNALVLAQKIVNRGNLIRSSVNYMPFRTGVFNKILLLEVIEHLPDDEAKMCFRDIYRVLKRGGTLYASTEHTCWWLNLLFIVYRELQQRLPIKTSTRGFVHFEKNVKKIQSWLNKSGFLGIEILFARVHVPSKIFDQNLKSTLYNLLSIIWNFCPYIFSRIWIIAKRQETGHGHRLVEEA